MDKDELSFSKAKDAVHRSRSLAAIREARGAITDLGDSHHYHTPLEFPVASELLEVYLHRKSLPYHKQKAARVYLSSDRKVRYDSLAVEGTPDSTYVFGISSDSSSVDVKNLEVSGFDEAIAHAPLDQPSVTNIIDVDTIGLIVFKVFLKTTIGRMAREGMHRRQAIGDDEKAINEVKQLELLSRILHDNPQAYSPHVFGRNGAVVAMEYIQGDVLSTLTSRGVLKKEHFIQVADVLAALHTGMEKNAAYVRENFPIPEWHTANSVISFQKKAGQVQEGDWNKEFSPRIFSKFMFLVDKARATIETHQYDNFPDVIFGDIKDENMIAMPDGRIAVLDPALCAGRKSMDIAKFARSIIFKNPSLYSQFFPDLLQKYRETMTELTSDEEIAHMLGIDMLNIMRGYMQIPERVISQFPPVVHSARVHSDFHFSIIENALDGGLALPVTP